MIYSQCPKDIGNADNIINHVAKGSAFVIFRYEELFNFFSKEPISIAVRKTQDAKKELLECVFRVRIWKTQGECVSWGIYSAEKEHLNSFVVRKVKWDLDKDTEFAKEHMQEDWIGTFQKWPSITIYNKYIQTAQGDKLVELLNKFDCKLRDGFSLMEDKKREWKWRDLEIMRKFDWGRFI